MDGLMDDRNVQTTRACRCTSPRSGQGCFTWSRRSRTFLTAVTWCLVLLVLCQPHCVQGMKPRLRFMEYHCSKTLNVYTELLLALKPSHLLPDVRSSDRHSHMTCKVMLRAPPGSRIFLHFLWLRVSADRQHHDRVKIYDKFARPKERTPKGGIYGNLDRPLVIQDHAGSKVEDYMSSQNEIEVEYVGIPTTQHPGFKILVTVYQTPDSSGRCPTDHFKCPVERGVCVPYSSACDGYANCGARDNGDEKDCDSFETVTDLVDDYSLVYDIVVMTCLPVLVFVAVALTALCCMRRYIRLKITIQAEPPVRYSSANGGKARVKLTDDKAMARLYAPPSYEDVVTPTRAAIMAPPPAYSTLSERMKSGEVEIIDSEDEMYRMSPRGQKRYARYRQERLSRGGTCTDSMSSLEEKPSPRARRHELNPRPYKGSYEPSSHRGKSHASNGSSIRHSDTDEEDEKERRNKKKGGKAKRTVCAKRRADEVTGDMCHMYVNVGDENNQLIPSRDHQISPSHPPTTLAVPNSTSPTFSSPQSPSHSHPPSPYSSQPSPGSPKHHASPESLPPPPSYNNIGKDLPPTYQPRGSHISPRNTPNLNNAKSKQGLTNTPPESHLSVPQANPELPCNVDTNSHSSQISSLPKMPNSSPIGRQPMSTTSSPSPSSCSTGDQDQTSHSETESRPPSNTNSRTESNGSLAEHYVNMSATKEKFQEGAIPEAVLNES